MWVYFEMLMFKTKRNDIHAEHLRKVIFYCQTLCYSQIQTILDHNFVDLLTSYFDNLPELNNDWLEADTTHDFLHLAKDQNAEISLMCMIKRFPGIESSRLRLLICNK